MRHPFPFAILVLFIALSGCVEKEPSSFSYEEPAGFESFDDEFVTMFYEIGPDYEIGAVISIMKPAPAETPMTQIWEDLKQIDLEECQNPEFSEIKPYTVNGIQGQQLVTTCSQEESPYTVNRIIFEKGSYNTGFSFTDSTETYRQKLPVFEALLESIQWE
jgi:hypothetical protein